jgi:hypothetical protein
MSSKRKLIRDQVVGLAFDGHPPSEIKDLVGSKSVSSIKAILSQERRRGIDIPRFTSQGNFRK